MTKSVADKTSIPATLRGHTDPPGMWVSILLCSAMLHASAFLIMRSLDFASFKPKHSSSSIPIEIIRVPKRQTRTQSRLIVLPKAPPQLQSAKPQVAVPQVSSAVKPQLVKPVIPETQQRNAIAFVNPNITKTPTPKIQPSIKPKVKQKISSKPQSIKNLAQQLQRQQRIAQQLQRQQQQQRQQELQEQQDIAQQLQRQQELQEQQRQQDIAKNQPGIPKSSTAVVVDKNPRLPPGGEIATNHGTTGGFLTASLSVSANKEQQTNLNLPASVKFIPQLQQKTTTPNKLPVLNEKDRQLITKPITCPVILSIDAKGQIFKDKGIIIPNDAEQPDVCKRYAEEYFKQNRANIEIIPGRNSANQPVSSGLWVEIEIQPVAAE